MIADLAQIELDRLRAFHHKRRGRGRQSVAVGCGVAVGASVVVGSIVFVAVGTGAGVGRTARGEQAAITINTNMPETKVKAHEILREKG